MGRGWALNVSRAGRMQGSTGAVLPPTQVHLDLALRRAVVVGSVGQSVSTLDAVGPSHECPHGRTLLGCARDSWGLEAVVRPPRMGSWLGRPNIVPLLARVSDRAPHVMLTVGVPKDGPTSSFPGTGAPCCALSDVCCRQDVE